ncbi:M20/M25/M40 family metallo-hydrolase [Halorussus gelatinilyticus]|uniref:Putative [LysW]-lysine/[LysW]-ornithine hydrolase n=1 Tax=Halorussus gelatinilyticus TaxID=2937524 RepID=A0A8U0ILW8_9EURY|nr:M20/M25/M40 family metallo-hydrolase [Halorussus gelatinilyticus]UPW01676.1 M20/M25/M40 family metallo-hydrolase [Halorussus gelatinilyticus]
MSQSADVSVGDAAARDLLVDLVEIPSPTGDERACAERLAAFFEERGREVRIDEAGNVRAPADDSVLLTSHIDTVPGDIPVEMTDGELWGRGSVDAKGPLAAMAAAAIETGVSFVGVVGEETDSRGARFLVEDREEPDAVVNGEPSGWDGVTLGYRGFLSGEYAVSTDSAHTSRPEANAIQDAMAWWQAVESAFSTESEAAFPSAEADGNADGEEGASADDDAPVFEQVTAKPVEFSGGVAADGLSVDATVEAQFRIPPGETAAGIRETVEDELESGEIEWNEPIPPVMETPRSEVARAFRTGIRRVGGDPRLLRKTGTSDMNLYAAAWDCPMATYGPGDSELDHAPNEHLDLGAFDRAVAVLEHVSETLQS